MFHGKRRSGDRAPRGSSRTPPPHSEPAVRQPLPGFARPVGSLELPCLAARILDAVREPGHNRFDPVLPGLPWRGLLRSGQDQHSHSGTQGPEHGESRRVGDRSLLGRRNGLDGEAEGVQPVVHAADFCADLGVLSGCAGDQIGNAGVHGVNLSSYEACQHQSRSDDGSDDAVAGPDAPIHVSAHCPQPIAAVPNPKKSRCAAVRGRSRPVIGPPVVRAGFPGHAIRT